MKNGFLNNLLFTLDPVEALGEGWHTPSAAEWSELVERCEWIWEGSGYINKDCGRSVRPVR
ncbi:MAG: hypothetical protein KBS67_03535 [Bacteroidales bacterium]|nr:hypothetical protein [Candidatus Cryptobacteroides equifaecalis]